MLMYLAVNMRKDQVDERERERERRGGDRRETQGERERERRERERKERERELFHRRQRPYLCVIIIFVMIENTNEAIVEHRLRRRVGGTRFVCCIELDQCRLGVTKRTNLAKQHKSSPISINQGETGFYRRLPQSKNKAGELPYEPPDEKGGLRCFFFFFFFFFFGKMSYRSCSQLSKVCFAANCVEKSLVTADFSDPRCSRLTSDVNR